MKFNYYYSKLSEQITSFNLVANEAVNKVQSMYMQGGYSENDACGVTLITIT